MSTEPPEITFQEPPRRCSQCGTELTPGVAACPHCEVRVIDAIDASNVHVLKSFGLGELMFVVGTAAVCLAAARLAPGFGIALAVIATIALARTAGGIARARAVGWPLSAKEKVVVFVVSLLVATTILMAASIAFVATCLPIGAVGAVVGGPGIIVAFGCGIVAAVLTTRYMVKAVWMLWERNPR